MQEPHEDHESATRITMHEYCWDRESVTRRIMRRQGFCT